MSEEAAAQAQEVVRVTAYLGLGSNIGDADSYLTAAVHALVEQPRIFLTGVSRRYRTAAIGLEDQPDFRNMVVQIVTSLGPFELLDVCQLLETDAGRERIVRWGPRTLDVDVLWYDGTFIDHERLQVPHPRMEERRFVLEPLADLAPELVLGSGRSVREALAGTLDQEVVPVDPRKE
ncbi:MAG: 2-amino-4-hydroxy-6-hydroxymethyldihydropteridine diphosphokinase [Thermoleophilia bacterium]